MQIPTAATAAFHAVVPIGGIGGIRFTAPGTISLATGTFTQTGSILVPYAAIYGIDALLYGAAGAAYIGSRQDMEHIVTVRFWVRLFARVQFPTC